MAGQSQPKTKAELLRELQSIKSLLDEPTDLHEVLDEDDIPLLDEFLDDDDGDATLLTDAMVDQAADEETDEDIPLLDQAVATDETIDALNEAYAALTGDLEHSETNQKDNAHEAQQKPLQVKTKSQTSAQATSRGNAASHPAQVRDADANPQPDAEPAEDEPGIKPLAADEFGSEQRDELVQAEHRTDPVAPAPLPGQQHLFDAEHDKSAAAEKPSTSKPSIKKASGENPFLPQHIRERLRGNQPMPTEAYTPYNPFNDGLKPNFSAVASPRSEAQQISDAKLAEQFAVDAAAAAILPSPPTEDSDDCGESDDNVVNANSSHDAMEKMLDELVAELMPEIEVRLRQKLAEQLNASFDDNKVEIPQHKLTAEH